MYKEDLYRVSEKYIYAWSHINYICLLTLDFLLLLTREVGAGSGSFRVIIFLSVLSGTAPMIFARSVNFFKPVRVVNITRNNSRSSAKFDIVNAIIRMCMRALSFIAFGLDLWKRIFSVPISHSVDPNLPSIRTGNTIRADNIFVHLLRDRTHNDATFLHLCQWHSEPCIDEFYVE